ncbi:hypothetical protein B0T16DRAFT_457353 [Cercophora newfieldiana]|uniref:Uncharacterized protein n=1 Tax=Cercophora newfieldiana TaxID=92897 RepID=A0AA39YC91_9PEZI|nr:hypothetical protein B0T16DRAFT_457353 [Cercophora newfieldiana]
MSAPSPLAAPAAAASAEEHGLSETDRKFLEHAITCLKSPPEIDLQKLAAKMGVKPKTVSNRWGELRKKLFANAANAGSADGEEGASPPVPATPRKRKAPAEGGAAKKTPRKKSKKTPGGETPVVTIEEDDDAGNV